MEGHDDFEAIGPDDPAGRLLRAFWQPVFLSERLRKGRAVPLAILGEEFTLYRGESGAAQVVAPFCAHRGLRLSVARVKGDCLECFYHGWTYDQSGRCVAQPVERRPFADRIRIAAYPTREYLGLVFAYFGGGEPPEFPRFDAFERGGFTEAKESRRDWSFFNQLENSVDESHFNFTHLKSKFSDVGLTQEAPELDCEETEYGILRIGRRGNRVRRSHILMPNCMYSMVYEDYKGWAEHLAWRVPVERHSHVSFQVDCIHKEGAEAEAYRQTRRRHREELARLEPAASVVRRILAGEIHCDDVDWRPDIVLIQDGVAIGGLPKGRDRGNDTLGASDRQVAMLRRIWAREMTAISDGRPIKRWHVPPGLVPTTGTEVEKAEAD